MICVRMIVSILDPWRTPTGSIPRTKPITLHGRCHVQVAPRIVFFRLMAEASLIVVNSIENFFVNLALGGH